MSKILVGIPVVTGAQHCKEAIESVIGYGDVLVIDNGADQEVIDALVGLSDRIVAGWKKLYIIKNEKNIYVNPAWNQIMKHFLEHEEYDRLIIMNSDLTMQHPWEYVCDVRWSKDGDEILIPNINPNKTYPPYPYFIPANVVSSGTPGVFITLNRKQVEEVYPIPDEIRIWFGDNYIYEILRGIGYNTVVVPNLIGTTSWSQTISRVPRAYDIIEEDKVAWELIKHKVQEKIKQHKP